MQTLWPQFETPCQEHIHNPEIKISRGKLKEAEKNNSIVKYLRQKENRHTQAI